MHAMIEENSVTRMVSAIQALDLESVKSRVMDAELGEGWSREYADSIETAYKTYLTMLIKYPDDSADIMLSKDVDEFWHTHILQTVKYTEDCERVFGFYLHHFPHVGERTVEDLERREVLAAKTQSLYAREFGTAEKATAAWAGKLAAALPEHVQARQTAYSSGPGIGTGSAAYSSGPGVRANVAAYSSGPGVSAGSAAYSSGPGIRADVAAYSSGPGISAESAAYSSGPGIRADAAAYSSGPGISGAGWNASLQTVAA